MEEVEYKKRLEAIELESKTAKNKLYWEYGISNAKFKIGDWIADERFSFVIDKITVSKWFDLPEPVYHGFELKKDGTRKKNNNRVSIHGNNCTLING